MNDSLVDYNPDAGLTYHISITEDISQILTSDCISELYNWGAIHLTGKDTVKFLQGQLTCDVTQINNNQGLPGAYCNAQGRIIAVFIAVAWQEGILLLMPRSIVINTINILKKYAVFSQVSLADVSSSLQICGLSGPTISSYDVSKFITLSGQRYLSLHEQSTTDNMQLIKVGTVAWHYLQLQHGFPNIYPITQEKLLPHRINLQLLNAISFNKGCYVGQEIIARTHFKATLKHCMYLYQVTGNQNLLPGDIITLTNSDLKIGEIVDCCPGLENTQLALAIMLMEYHDSRDVLINQQGYKFCSLGLHPL